MDATTRRKLSMAAKALAFERAQPSEDASHAAVVARLTGVVAAADLAVGTEEAGTREERLARRRRRMFRRALRERLRHLDRVSRVSGGALSGKFAPPPHNAPNRAFIAAARRRFEDATAAQEALLAAGLGGSFLLELEAGLAEFDREGTSADDARGDHVRARSELGSLAAEAVRQVNVLDGLNATRFATQPALLDEWRAMRNIFGPVSRSSGEPELPTAEEPSAPNAARDAA
jgi:hypothetical protein